MIVVKLTPQEARAYQLTKDVDESQIENTIFLEAWVSYSGLEPEGIKKGIEPMVKAAKRARRKIEKATAFRIEIEG